MHGLLGNGSPFASQARPLCVIRRWVMHAPCLFDQLNSLPRISQTPRRHCLAPSSVMLSTALQHVFVIRMTRPTVIRVPAEWHRGRGSLDCCRYASNICDLCWRRRPRPPACIKHNVQAGALPMNTVLINHL